MEKGDIERLADVYRDAYIDWGGPRSDVGRILPAEVHAVRAVLREMREPRGELVEAGMNAILSSPITEPGPCADEAALAVWRTMLDHLLEQSS
jgi:hypothetical protein